jgi:RNA polymerase sigma-70 factor (ECF subfamily)
VNGRRGLEPSSFAARLLDELPALWRTARRMTRSGADAEDLVQATVVRALERKQELREPERIRGWLLRVQRTVALNGVRGARHRLEVIDGGEGAPEPRGDLEADILGRGFADEVERALGTLQPEWRDALLLREVEELSYEEIARIQACPVGTVRSRLARARLAIVEAMTAKDRTEDGEERCLDAASNGSRASRRFTMVK